LRDYGFPSDGERRDEGSPKSGFTPSELASERFLARTGWSFISDGNSAPDL
jgi:hypothetical protein